MRFLLPLLTASLLAAPLVAGAETPCTEAEPCPLAVDVDEATLSLAGGASHQVTAGDWFLLDVFNSDGPDHQITIADLDVSFIAPGLDGSGPDSQHGPFAFDAPGSYEVTDLTTGATATLHVVEGDVASGGDQDKRSPGPGLAVLMIAGMAGAWSRRAR